MKVWLGLAALLFAMAFAADRYLLTPQEPPLLIDEPDQIPMSPAQAIMPQIVICHPVLIGRAGPKPISRT